MDKEKILEQSKNKIIELLENSKTVLFSNEETIVVTGDKKEIPDITKEFAKDSLNNGNLTLLLDNLTSGIWGIAVIDDENKNGKLDMKFFIPKEGFGFSNYTFSKHCKPEFEEFSFLVTDGENNVTVNMFYF